MRAYLTGFFKDFEYEEKDAEELLGAYDVIVANEETNALLCEALSAYERDIALDYDAEILQRISEIAQISQVHVYTAGLLVFLCMTKHLRLV